MGLEYLIGATLSHKSSSSFLFAIF